MFDNGSNTKITITTMSWGRQRQGAPRVPISATGGVSSPEILNVNIQADYKESIHDTEDIFKAEKTVKYHNWRIMAMIKWVEKEYSDYYQQDVVDITEEQKGYKRGYNTYTHSFIYRTLNVDAIKAFMSKNKYKTDQFNNDGKPLHYSFYQLCKFNNAI